MGRHYYGTKAEADNLKNLKISWLKKQGYLNESKKGTISWTYPNDNKHSIGITTVIDGDFSHIMLYYSQTDNDGNKKDFNYKIPLTFSNCNYGGQRYWFICPLIKNNAPCNKRVGVLYKNGDYFGCRHCYELTYQSKNQSKRIGSYPAIRAFILAEKIEAMKKKMGRCFYARSPTKKQKKIDRYYRELRYWLKESDYYQSTLTKSN